MEQRSALPSINGNSSDPLVQDTRPTSSVAIGGHRALRMSPKSAGASSVARRTRHSEGTLMPSWQPYENQVQRPLSTQVSPRDVAMERMMVQIFTSTASRIESKSPYQQHEERLREPEDSFQGDSKNKVQQLRDENATFRHENEQLRTKLVEKMRGQSKIVAGGQFRAASASTAAKVPRTPSSVCPKCSSARARAIKAHKESEQAQAATAELRKYVDKVEAAQQRRWEERSAHVQEIAQLRDKLAAKVEECVLVEAECSKLAKFMEILRREKDIDELLLPQPLVDKELIDCATQCILQQREDDEIQAVKATQEREIAGLNTQVQLLVLQLKEHEIRLNDVSKNLKEAQKAMILQRDQYNDEVSSWREENSEFKRRILELEQIKKNLRVSVQDLAHTHEKELLLLQKTNQELRENVVAKQTEMQRLDEEHKTETISRDEHQQMLVKALKVRIKQKVADVDRLHALLVDFTAQKAANAAMKTRIQALEEEVQTLTNERAQMVSDTLRQRQQTAELAQIEREKLLNEAVVEQQQFSDALEDVQVTNRSLKTRISEVGAELVEYDVLMQRQSRSHTRAMERLLESSLRLCVVAPTVNVQLTTNGASLSSKNNNYLSLEKLSKEKDPSELMSIMCRSTPQQATIKRVIENDVLPLFTSVFIQDEDNASPQAHVPMACWLQNLLQDMQLRIAAQLESIYSSASSKGQ